jgi:hypothetical protein
MWIVDCFVAIVDWRLMDDCRLSIAQGQKPKAKQPKAKSQKPKAESRKPKAESRKPNYFTG